MEKKSGNKTKYKMCQCLSPLTQTPGTGTDRLKGLTAASQLFWGRVVFWFLSRGAVFPNICWWEKHLPRWLKKSASVRMPAQ